MYHEQFDCDLRKILKNLGKAHKPRCTMKVSSQKKKEPPRAKEKRGNETAVKEMTECKESSSHTLGLPDPKASPISNVS